MAQHKSPIQKQNRAAHDLRDVASKHAKLGDRIEQSTFEERRRAVEKHVKEIRVQPQTIDGRLIPVVIITYRFDDPSQIIAPPSSTVIVDHTSAHRDTHNRTYFSCVTRGKKVILRVVVDAN